MINQIKTFIIDRVDPTFIILFGSVAKGEIHQLSDVDIAFYKEDFELNAYEVFLLAQELADLLKREVDLIDLSKASTVFKAQVYGTGEVIYCRNETILNSCRMTALSMYVRLNEERAKTFKKYTRKWEHLWGVMLLLIKFML